MVCHDGEVSVPIAQLVRNGFVEGVHYGSAVVLNADGSVLWSMGDVESQIFPRSCNKLMQGLAMVRSGVPLNGRLLSLACASHSGEQFHVDGVHDILNAANLDVDSLQCPVDFPLDDVEKDSLLAQGLEKSRLHMNCSGKHAAMLFTCVLNGWDTATYLELNHPLQQACKSVVEECTEEAVQHFGIDGCGAPLMSTSLTGLARSFAKFAGLAADSDQRKIADAIRAFPEYESGTRRDDYLLMKGVPGLLAKIGAEAVYGIGLPDGRALALKIDDGADRARIVAGATILRDIMGVKADIVEQQTSLEVLGGGQPVGAVTATLKV
jgi:L-asparaginase II